MSSNHLALQFSRLSLAILRMRVHVDALLRAPNRYLAAAWWGLTGKRLRSRARFAPLLGRSAQAYALWIAQWEGYDVATTNDIDRNVRIVAIIEDSAGSSELLAGTFGDLSREGIDGHLIRSADLLQPEVSAVIKEADWLMLIQAGDRLSHGAGCAYRSKAGRTLANVIYADDDLLGANGRRIQPHFKPEWNAELFRSHDFLTGASIVRASCIDPESMVPADWVHTALQADELRTGSSLPTEAQAPVHLKRVLHHRRTRPLPRETGQLSIPATAKHMPCVSVIIPTRNRVDLLRTCLDGLAATDYPDIEILVVDNGSDDHATLEYLSAFVKASASHHVLRVPGPFNYSRLNNLAAGIARGELLCLLNNDIEMRSGDWLSIMVRQAMRADVGAVGAQLLYPDGRIQHAGVVLGISGAAAHAHRFLRPEDTGYHRRHALAQYVSAVTAACLVVRADRFAAVGGLDEQNFEVAFNDVDLCLRLNLRGWQSLYEPRAVLIHHESVSRGLDRDPIGRQRFARELSALRRKWQTECTVDPFHHPQLSSESEEFVIGLTRSAKSAPPSGVDGGG